MSTMHSSLKFISVSGIGLVCFTLALLNVWNQTLYLSSQKVVVPTEGKRKLNPIKVFYNVYVNPKNVELAKSIFKEQASHFNNNHDVFLRTIGHPLEELQDMKGDNTLIIKLQHNNAGDEHGTLTLIWQHCMTTRETDKVVYIHNKGSYHPHEKNDKFRRFLTRGALSDECANMPLTCNVCSSRFSPYPHPHTSGNMWVAKCDYIRNLPDPTEFAEKMKGLQKPGMRLMCVGQGRYTSEHWIHSHPAVKPCDLSTEKKYVWNYEDIPTGDDWEIDLEAAPRYDFETYKGPGGCADEITDLNYRLNEYKFLYNETVPDDWWGWKIWSRDEKRI